MPSLDESPKPLRQAGTPSYRIRNYYAAGFLAAFSAIGLAMHYSGLMNRWQRFVNKFEPVYTEAEKVHRHMEALQFAEGVQTIVTKKGYVIRELQSQESKIDREKNTFDAYKLGTMISEGSDQ